MNRIKYIMLYLVQCTIFTGPGMVYNILDTFLKINIVEECIIFFNFSPYLKTILVYE